MPVEESRRAQPLAAAATSLGQEAADTLMELVTPAGHDPATRQDIQGVLTALDHLDERWTERLGAMDHRLEAMEQRLTATFERGLREAITSQTRSLTIALLVSVVAIAGLAFGLAGA